MRACHRQTERDAEERDHSRERVVGLEQDRRHHTGTGKVVGKVQDEMGAMWGRRPEKFSDKGMSQNSLRALSELEFPPSSMSLAAWLVTA